MRTVLVFSFLFVFWSSCACLATPMESVPEPNSGGPPVAVDVVQVTPTLKLPDTPVHMFIREGTESRFEGYFIDARYGWDVEDYEFYKIWCLEKGRPLPKNTIYKVRLYDYTSPDLPPRLKDMDFNRINYILNHKPQSASKKTIQEAVWYFTGAKNIGQLSPEAVQLIEEAKQNGKDYIPHDGDLVTVVCMPVNEEKQATIIELAVPALVAPAKVAAVAPTVASSSLWGFDFIIPPVFFGGGGGGGGGNVIHHHGISEPGTLALLLTAAVCYLIMVRSRTRIGK
ncbi:MAG TPA: hypothetical protein VEF34_02745 [Syntrophobacteraceae bacterium]|nr:hypothetical protein [Syntrophobacteraceae bacterium]